MYDYIKGKLTKITAKYIIIEAGGLGYIVNVANPYRLFRCDESRYPSLPSVK